MVWPSRVPGASRVVGGRRGRCPNSSGAAFLIAATGWLARPWPAPWSTQPRGNLEAQDDGASSGSRLVETAGCCVDTVEAARQGLVRARLGSHLPVASSRTTTSQTAMPKAAEVECSSRLERSPWGDGGDGRSCPRQPRGAALRALARSDTCRLHPVPLWTGHHRACPHCGRARLRGARLALLPALWTTSAPGAFGSSPCVRSSVPICAVTASTRIWWPAAQLTQSDHGPAARGGSTPPPSYLRGPGCPWHNSSRCIGRLYWRSLRVATNRGRVRPTLTVFAPSAPERPGPRIWNEQLIRYAGYR